MIDETTSEVLDSLQSLMRKEKNVDIENKAPLKFDILTTINLHHDEGRENFVNILEIEKSVNKMKLHRIALPYQ